MGIIEDIVPSSYPYAWTTDSDLPIQEFLAKFKPSMVQDDGTKPWIFVTGSASFPKIGDKDVAIEEASRVLNEITEKVESIKSDASIPTRSNKKTGAKSKKELREQAQAEATEKLKEISVKHGYVDGKWLIFAPSDKVDIIWTSLATSLVSGPLSSTPAFQAKVATCPRNETPNYQHVICLYIPDVYDKKTVTEVMKILLRNHGMNLSGVKSNIYTSLGIDSKHPSGLQSTIWKNSALMKDTEIKELRDAFFTELANTKAAATLKSSDDKETETKASASKPKTKKKKKVEDDPFESDDQNDGDDAKEEIIRKQQLKTKKNVAAAKKRAKESDESADDEDTEDKPKVKRRK